MSQAQKDALARGRKEARAIKQYLASLASRKRGRPASPAKQRERIEALKRKSRVESDPLRKLELTQQRIDAENRLARMERVTDQATLEREFIRYARSYSERKGISYTAWRESGVSAAVLSRAGITRTRSA